MDKLSEKLERMKVEVRRNFNESELYCRPILKSPKLWETELYKFCEEIPKGADLHAHGGALIPVHELIKFVALREDILIDTNPKHKSYLRLKCKNPYKTYMPLQQALDNHLIDTDEIIKLWTLIGRPLNIGIWDWFQELFEKHNDLNEVGPTCKDYFQYSYEYYCKHNIFHLEQRLFLKNSEEEAFRKAHCAYDAYIDAKKKYPKLTVRIIPVGLKNPVFDMSVTENIFNNAAAMHHRIKDEKDSFVAGIDLVNEEDSSRSISDFEELISQTIKKAQDLNIDLHAGESLNPNNDEISKAISLGSKRIGHGLNLWAHPEKKQVIKDRDICLEVCPVSNQILGYCEDLRKHPAKDYFRESIPIALCSDDATYQENSTLSDDFFVSILAWDLNISEIKTLCENSIKYSFLADRLKQTKLENLYNDWDKFENKILDR